MRPTCSGATCSLAGINTFNGVHGLPNGFLELLVGVEVSRGWLNPFGHDLSFVDRLADRGLEIQRTRQVCQQRCVRRVGLFAQRAGEQSRNSIICGCSGTARS